MVITSRFGLLSAMWAYHRPRAATQGGQTIEQIQKNSGARVQLSRAGEFYPGERQHVACGSRRTVVRRAQRTAVARSKARQRPST